MLVENLFLFSTVGLPIAVYWVDSTYKARHGGDRDFVGADLHLCGFSTLFPVVLHCELSGKVAGEVGGGLWVASLFVMLMWFKTLEVASNKTRRSTTIASMMGAAFFIGSLMIIDNLRRGGYLG